MQLFIFKIRRVSFVFLLFDESLTKSFGIVTSVYICMSSRLSVCLNHVSTITKLDYFPYWNSMLTKFKTNVWILRFRGNCCRMASMALQEISHVLKAQTNWRRWFSIYRNIFFFVVNTFILSFGAIKGPCKRSVNIQTSSRSIIAKPAWSFSPFIAFQLWND